MRRLGGGGAWGLGAGDRPDDRGAVAAEFAVALPVVALVLVFGVTMLGVSSAQVRLQDAAADAARLAARGESAARVLDAVESAVAGAQGDIEQRGDLVCVMAQAPTRLPLRIAATSCALAGGF
ncbi:Flp pilus assembly protein TadG [Microbacterium terrae]|uniref:TadE-like domain-containing protein n=1 Tax=Microbacterium terrae TaxID=69369 RepID=A0A0M2HN55_9MICO|nr:TadE family type IV pilus minor pilin [Microbacterium terrae]KJL45904.1 hypothetical protein RS81_00005 [Microbacterium terrae]MBP1076617.1 Flp pilus assembly protein TadG [Microbacterium terrae]GLJ97445.1 hypothetical protein GCM10017594_06420 [Microbacterium terrae]